MSDKVFDVEVMSVDSSGNIACDGSLTPAGGVVGVVNGPSGSDLTITCDAGNILTIEGYDATVIQSTGGNTIFQDQTRILVRDLPTSDPLLADQLWNDSGTLKISAG